MTNKNFTHFSDLPRNKALESYTNGTSDTSRLYMCLVTRLNGYDGRMVCYSYQFTWHVVRWFNIIRRETTAKFTYLKSSILQNKENEFKSVLPINLAELTHLTVGASIACWTPTLVWVWSSHTLTTIVTWMKSNTEICLQLTVLSTVREQMYRLNVQ
jgi:hypothetical protein